jgi:hypothetical protein
MQTIVAISIGSWLLAYVVVLVVSLLVIGRRRRRQSAGTSPTMQDEGPLSPFLAYWRALITAGAVATMVSAIATLIEFYRLSR